MGVKLYDYECFTTFWEDFNIAEAFGAIGVQDTFERAFNEWKSDYKYLTELVMVLNHRGWMHYSSRQNKTDAELYELYFNLFRQAQTYAYENLKGDELTYFFRTTD